MKFIKSFPRSRKKKKGAKREEDLLLAPPIPHEHVLPTVNDATTRHMRIASGFQASSSALINAIDVINSRAASPATIDTDRGGFDSRAQSRMELSRILYDGEAIIAENSSRRAPSPASRLTRHIGLHIEPGRSNSPFPSPSERSFSINASNSNISLPLSPSSGDHYTVSASQSHPRALSPRPIRPYHKSTTLDSPILSVPILERGLFSTAHSNSSQGDMRPTAPKAASQNHSVIGLTLGPPIYDNPSMSSAESLPHDPSSSILFSPYHSDKHSRTISTNTFGVSSSPEMEDSPDITESEMVPQSHRQPVLHRPSPDEPTGSHSPASPLSYDMPGTPQSYSSYDVTDQVREDGETVYDTLGDEKKRIRVFRETATVGIRRREDIRPEPLKLPEVPSQQRYDEIASNSSLNLPLEAPASQKLEQASWSESRWAEFKARKEQLLAQHAYHKRLKEKWRKLQQMMNGDRKATIEELMEVDNADPMTPPLYSPDRDMGSSSIHDVTPRATDFTRRNVDYFGLGFVESSGSAHSSNRLTPTGHAFYPGINPTGSRDGYKNTRF